MGAHDTALQNTQSHVRRMSERVTMPLRPARNHHWQNCVILSRARESVHVATGAFRLRRRFHLFCFRAIETSK